jgi:O-antigen/teichoic acid export membrane protein
VAGDRRKVRKSINEQAEIAILILAPMIIAMLVFLPFVVRLLYSGDFDGIVPMTRWLLLGSLLKAGSWAISFVFLAKGHGKTYLFNELGIKFFTLPTYMLGYRLFGLLGVGYAYVLCYGIYFLWVGIVAYRKYRLMYSGVFWRMLAFTTTVLAAYLLMEPLMISGGLHYWLGIPLIVLLSIYSLRELKKRLF